MVELERKSQYMLLSERASIGVAEIRGEDPSLVWVKLT